jgi:replicative DNA helicase
MSRLVDGWTFVSSAADGVPAIWGEGDAVLWAQGEPLMLVGPDGVGKTSLAQQLVRARLGLGRRTLLGLPVARTDGRVLYVAADRPPQAARSMKRMYQQGDEEVLRDRLVVHRGPLDFDIVSKPFLLREYVQNIEGVNTVVLDSVKDIAVKLSEDGVGGAVNIALQELVANDIDVLALHHQRKQQQNGGQPKALADVYRVTLADRRHGIRGDALGRPWRPRRRPAPLEAAGRGGRPVQGAARPRSRTHDHPREPRP